MDPLISIDGTEIAILVGTGPNLLALTVTAQEIIV